MRVLLSTTALLTGVVALALSRERHLTQAAREEWVESPGAPAQLQEFALHSVSHRQQGGADG